MTQLIKSIEKCYLFKDFTKDNLSELLKKLRGKTSFYKKGEIIIASAEIVNDIRIVVSGELCVSLYHESGKEQIIQKMKSSYLVGCEIAVSVNKDSPYTVYCTEEAEVFSFSADMITKEGILPQQEQNLLYIRCLEFLANENIRKFHTIELVSLHSVRAKILKYLELQRKRYKSDTFSIEYNREELASYLDINRSVLSHQLKQMEKDGIIEVHKNKFTLKN